MSWIRDLFCGPCECAGVDPQAPGPPIRTVATPVPATSPARLLAKSLTDPETRDEWAIEKSNLEYSFGHTTPYRNEKRDLTITTWWSVYGNGGISTPFTLSKAEEKIVSAALSAWRKHRSDVAEQAALARLTKATKRAK